MNESTAPTENTGDERLRATLADWQNWSATKLSETEMARLEYDLMALIRQDRRELLETLDVPFNDSDSDDVLAMKAHKVWNNVIKAKYELQHGAESGEA